MINSLLYYFPGKRDVAELLIENGADINALDYAGWTPLRAAAENGNFGYSCLQRAAMI